MDNKNVQADNTKDEMLIEGVGNAIIKTGYGFYKLTKNTILEVINIKDYDKIDWIKYCVATVVVAGVQYYIRTIPTNLFDLHNYVHNFDLITKTDYKHLKYNQISKIENVANIVFYATIPVTYFMLKGNLFKSGGEKVNYNDLIMDLFNNNVSIKKVYKDKKDKNKKEYILESKLHISNIEKYKKEIEHRLNTSILSIDYTLYSNDISIKTNKKLPLDIKLDGLQGNYKNKILTLLNNKYDLKNEYIESLENEYMTVHKFNMRCNFATIQSKFNDMSHKLKLSENDFNIERGKDGLIHFQIRNTEEKIYFLEDYINKVDKNLIDKMELPAIMGIDLSSGNIIVEDLHKFPHALIMGSTGSGKSCFINCLVQSSMYYKTNTSWIFTDFKYLELNQYKDFKNVTFIKTLEDVYKCLIYLENCMIERQQLFANVNVKTLESFNSLTGMNLPYIVFLIDEVADLKIKGDKSHNKLVNLTNNKLNSIINKARALGIDIIMSLQKAHHEQMDTGTRSQLKCKIGYMSEAEDGQFIGMKNLDKLKIGEYYLNTGNKTRKLKSFYIEDSFKKVRKNAVYETLYRKYTGKEYVYINRDSAINITNETLLLNEFKSIYLDRSVSNVKEDN
jgi:hypothetical protein